jgi:hypothetical protein
MSPEAVSTAGQKKGIFSLEGDQTGRRIARGLRGFADFACKIRLESMWRLPDAWHRRDELGSTTRGWLAQNGQPVV